MDGSPEGGWTRSQVFPPRGSSSTMDAKTSSLTSDMSEMALDMEPRPKKIRRRNAIKPLDQAHLPLLHNTLGEPFESASLLQSLEDGLLASSSSTSASVADCDDAMPAPLQFHRQPSLPSAKRKIPRPRLKANSTASFKSKHHRQKDVDMDIHSIRLHQDLTSHAPKNEILPESILKSYRDQYQSSLATLAATAAEFLRRRRLPLARYQLVTTPPPLPHATPSCSTHRQKRLSITCSTKSEKVKLKQPSLSQNRSSHPLRL